MVVLIRSDQNTWSGGGSSIKAMPQAVQEKRKRRTMLFLSGKVTLSKSFEAFPSPLFNIDGDRQMITNTKTSHARKMSNSDA